MTLPDQGPLYTETNLHQFPVEPFNTFSNIMFLLVALYWYRQLRSIPVGLFASFLKAGLPLLLVGFVGGTIYHATRAHYVWTLMDVVPIYLIGALTAYYHWRLVGAQNRQIVVIFIFLMVLPISLLWMMFPLNQHKYTLSYALLTVPVIIPLVYDLVHTRGRWLKSFLIPLALITLALSFRSLDSSGLVGSHWPVGTHFLWHLFGAFTCHFLLKHMRSRALEGP